MNARNGPVRGADAHSGRVALVERKMLYGVVHRQAVRVQGARQAELLAEMARLQVTGEAQQYPSVPGEGSWSP